MALVPLPLDLEPIARRLRVRGIVQGVGFRPFVYQLALRHGLAGWVRNDGNGVEIEVQGLAPALGVFAHQLETEAPPLARVDGLEMHDIPPDPRRRGFAILASAPGPVSTAIGPDSGTCPACLAELFDPADRRWRYPFINCTHCGPRYTITARLPYDRASTSMAGFALCADCGREYASPGDRRFHAEPNACPACGPRLSLLEAHGLPVLSRDPIASTLARLRAGEIVAIKGLGGFHLVCDARNPEAVARLRSRKRRPDQPLALMFAGLPSLAPWLRCSPAEAAALSGAQRPILLLGKQPGFDVALAGIAPGLDEAGAMLPYTPLQYLLFHEAAGRPAGTAWLEQPQPLVLVMTSANPHGEPLVRDNTEALARLKGIADVLLVHDRDILIRCDDSVLRWRSDLPGGLQFLRRARGFTPRALPLAGEGPAVLALGGHFKTTACLTRGREAFVSQHVGGLDNPAACVALEESARHLMGILQQRPALIAHDAHPDYYSSRLALQLAEELNVPTLAVQHHHAHVAAVCAEHRLEGPVLGFAADGVGLGSDGQPWGGELLRVDGAASERIGHLAPLALPGGDKAAREPWRLAVAVLHALGRTDLARTRFADEPALGPVLALLDSGRAGTTTSLGRWFDACAGLLGIVRRISYEGQAAMQLEALARRPGCVPPLEESCASAGPILDLRPLLARLIQEDDPAQGAALFHATLVDGLARWIMLHAQAAGLGRVVLAGGCLHNRLLAAGLRLRLQGAGLQVFEACQLPAGDGGIALGQAWVARQGAAADSTKAP